MMTHTDERYFVRQLTAILHVDSTNLSRELARLAGMGILVSQKEGRQKYYRANKLSPIFQELRGLVVKTSGAADILRNALAPLGKKCLVAFIFGSFANGREQSGSDADIMIIGDVKLGEIVKALGPAQSALGREINPVVYFPDEFKARVGEGHHFIQRVLSEKKIFLMGDENELKGLAQ
jgi:uncharacterized protein